MRLGKEAQSRTSAPLGLLCIATPLDLAGYRLRIIDQGFEPNWKNILLSELKKEPVCLGVSTKTGPQIRYAIEASRITKEHGSTPVVWGGVHPSLLPEQTLKDKNVDIIVQGEGEETFFELVKALEKDEPLSQVKGIWYKENGEIKRTESRPFIDLNKQPALSYHLVDLSRYSMRIFGIDHIWFSTSRGCPYNCGFCYNTVFNRRTWRGLTAEKALKDIKRIRGKYGFRGINLTDDLFFKDVERVRKIVSEVVDKKIDVVFSKLDIHGSELSKIDDEFLRLLEKAGCKTIVVGVESGSQRILDLINKNIKISHVIDFNKRIKRFHIIPKYCFVMGFPTETKEDIRQTVSLIFRLIEDNKEAMKDINIYAPYPGTDLFDLSLREGLKPPESLEDWVSVNWRTINRKNTPWVTRERENLLKMLHCSSLFLEKNYFLEPIWPTNPLIVMLARLYHPIAKKRVRSLYYKFPLEIKLAELLRLYPKQA
jgi:anaerobic magnesium-protoporphyrin IX monomethyl ester cyclase